MINDYTQDDEKMRSFDRVLSLAPMEGKTAKSAAGNVDSRLFTGEQTLHCKMDLQTNLWSFQYGQNGLLPGGLAGDFTSFAKALQHAELYFHRRNVKVAEVKD
jgi:hypothetical protein